MTMTSHRTCPCGTGLRSVLDVGAEMGLAAPRLGEGLVAEGALVGPLAGVGGPDVLVQTADDGVGRVTQVAAVGPGADVNPRVVHAELVAGHEALAAQVAGEGLDAQVGQGVHLVAGLGVEGLPAVLAHELLLPVLQGVLAQLPQLKERLPAGGAQVGLDGGVGLHVGAVGRGVVVTGPAHAALEEAGLVLAAVAVEGRAVLEALPAGVAGVGSLAGVAADVLVQAALGGHHLAALVAGDGGGAPVVLLLVPQPLAVGGERLVALGAGEGVPPSVPLRVDRESGQGLEGARAVGAPELAACLRELFLPSLSPSSGPALGLGLLALLAPFHGSLFKTELLLRP